MVVLFAAPDGESVDEAPVQNEPLDDATPMPSDKRIDHLIKQRAFMIVTRYHTQSRVDEKLSGPVGVDQADELVTTSPGIGRLFDLCEFLAVDRVIVLIEEQPHRTFIGGIVGNKQVSAIPDKDSFRIEGVV